jgi:hypothetical protein
VDKAARRRVKQRPNDKPRLPSRARAISVAPTSYIC